MQMKPSDAYRRRQTRPSSAQIMVCRLFGDKPVSEPMLPYCELDPKERTSVKFYLNSKSFHSRKLNCKCRLRNGVILSLPQCVHAREYMPRFILTVGPLLRFVVINYRLCALINPWGYIIGTGVASQQPYICRYPGGQQRFPCIVMTVT